MSSYMTSSLTNDAKSPQNTNRSTRRNKTTTAIIISLWTRGPCTQKIHLEAPQVTSTGDVYGCYGSYVTKPPKTPKYCS